MNDVLALGKEQKNEYQKEWLEHSGRDKHREFALKMKHNLFNKTG